MDTVQVGQVAAGDRFVLLQPDNGRRWLARADGAGPRKVDGIGVFDPDRLVGRPYGRIAQVGGRRLVPLQATLDDLSRTVRRKAQIILPKDMSRIVWELGIRDGDRVLESGVGSGAATVALLWTGADVVVQELRQDFADWARDNIEAAGLQDRCTIHVGDLTEGLHAKVEGGFDACLLDLPDPWCGIPNVAPALNPGGRIAIYTPQVSQMEQAHRALVDHGFLDVRSLELMERAWDVKERGSRPAHDGIGHTAFLTFGRKAA